ncbi:hypothetical protein YIM73052_19780 [Thermus antranikianii]
MRVVQVEVVGLQGQPGSRFWHPAENPGMGRVEAKSHLGVGLQGGCQGPGGFCNPKGLEVVFKREDGLEVERGWMGFSLAPS